MSEPAETRNVRVHLPASLRTLAALKGEVTLEVAGPVSPNSVIDALERAHPALKGTLRSGRERRAFIRYFACGEDISQRSPDEPLPEAVSEGREPFLVVGAIAGG